MTDRRGAGATDDDAGVAVVVTELAPSSLRYPKA